MDIFYYWKNYASDMKEGRVGTLGSEGDKLEELKQRLPRKVWTFVTPKGMKGKLQVVGSFLITETKPDTFVPKWKHNCSTMLRRRNQFSTPMRQHLSASKR